MNRFISKCYQFNVWQENGGITTNVKAGLYTRTIDPSGPIGPRKRFSPSPGAQTIAFNPLLNQFLVGSGPMLRLSANGTALPPVLDDSVIDSDTVIFPDSTAGSYRMFVERGTTEVVLRTITGDGKLSSSAIHLAQKGDGQSPAVLTTMTWENSY